MAKDYSKMSEADLRKAAREAGRPDADTADVETLRQAAQDRDTQSGSSSQSK